MSGLNPDSIVDTLSHRCFYNSCSATRWLEGYLSNTYSPSAPKFREAKNNSLLVSHVVSLHIICILLGRKKGRYLGIETRFDIQK